MNWRKQLEEFKPGDNVKLTNYEDWSDYISHKGEITTIIRPLPEGDFDWEI